MAPRGNHILPPPPGSVRTWRELPPEKGDAVGLQGGAARKEQWEHGHPPCFGLGGLGKGRLCIHFLSRGTQPKEMETWRACRLWAETQDAEGQQGMRQLCCCIPLMPEKTNHSSCTTQVRTRGDTVIEYPNWKGPARIIKSSSWVLVAQWCREQIHTEQSWASRAAPGNRCPATLRVGTPSDFHPPTLLTAATGTQHNSSYCWP